MVTIVDKLVTQIQVKTSKAISAMTQFHKKIGGIRGMMQRFNRTTRNLAAGLKQIFLGTGLSFLFTGMAIKRFFQSILTSMFTLFLKVEGQGGEVNNKLNNLRATLEFLKFSFVEAFKNTGMLDVWISRIDGLIEKFNSLDEETKAQITSFTVWGVIIGATLMVVGQMMLGLMPILFLIQLAGLFPVVIILGLIAAAALFLFTVWTSGFSKNKKIILTILILLGLVFIALGILTAPIWLIGAAVVALLAVFVIFHKQIQLFMLKIGQAIQTWFLDKLNDAIELVNNLIRAFNKITGASVNLIEKKEGFDFSSKISSLQSELNKDKQKDQGSQKGNQLQIFQEINGNVLTENDLNKTIKDTINEEINNTNGSPQS